MEDSGAAHAAPAIFPSARAKAMRAVMGRGTDFGKEVVMWGDAVKQYLDREGVTYRTISHAPAYTAQEVAAAAHVSGKEVAKTLVVKLDGRPALVALPASEHVAFGLLAAATGARRAELAGEGEFQSMFPDCERGAMPPFGNLYALPIFVSDTLAEDEEIAFNGGSFTELIEMRYRDFERLAQPTVVRLSASVGSAH
jgi:Ala-tRNA(Pro) deacylase